MELKTTEIKKYIGESDLITLTLYYEIKLGYETKLTIPYDIEIMIENGEIENIFFVTENVVLHATFNP